MWLGGGEPSVVGVAAVVLLGCGLVVGSWSVVGCVVVRVWPLVGCLGGASTPGLVWEFGAVPSGGVV